MDDPTDTGLGIAAGIGMLLVCICGIVATRRRDRETAIKISRSDNDLENMLSDSLPTGGSRGPSA